MTCRLSLSLDCNLAKLGPGVAGGAGQSLHPCLLGSGGLAGKSRCARMSRAAAPYFARAGASTGPALGTLVLVVKCQSGPVK